MSCTLIKLTTLKGSHKTMVLLRQAMALLFRTLAIARAASALATTPTSGSLAAPASRFRAFADGIYDLQDSMIAQATAADPAATWSVEDHAKGRAVVLEGGGLWEKGCISVTLIERGELSAARAEAISARTGNAAIVEGARYSACALSFVLHAASPHVPTLRGDARCFSVDGADEWFGGGRYRCGLMVFSRGSSGGSAASA